MKTVKIATLVGSLLAQVNAIVLDFNMTGEWMQVSRKKTGVPAELVPEAIRQYVATNYPEKAIFKLKKRPYGYKISLSDDSDLRFNPQGLFLEEVD
jgi:hypothetical protein